MAEYFYNPPTALEQRFNRFFGVLVRLGLALPHNYLLVVRGRKTGSEYSMPVDVLTFDGRRFLVAPRGETQWARNVRAAGEVTLKKGVHVESAAAVPVGDEDKAPLLKAYLDRFRRSVSRYFLVPPGAPVESFRPLAPRYPVFELKPLK
jgi:deazaflavin-dependent oxidoreductase (nitroreductase family)